MMATRDPDQLLRRCSTSLLLKVARLGVCLVFVSDVLSKSILTHYIIFSLRCIWYLTSGIESWCEDWSQHLSVYRLGLVLNYVCSPFGIFGLEYFQLLASFTAIVILMVHLPSRNTILSSKLSSVKIQTVSTGSWDHSLTCHITSFATWLNYLLQ